MQSLGQWAIPPKGTPKGDAFRKFATTHPVPPEIKKAFKKATSRLVAQLENGAGLPVDEEIRYFLQEYNTRNFEHGLMTMPSSFNVLEAFIEYHPDLSYFSLREENDHLVSFSDFFDYATSPDCPADISSSAYLLEEGTIFSFNALNAPDEITFSIQTGAEYAIGGFSVVRHSDELSVILLAGEKTDTSQKTLELKNTDLSGTPVPGKEKVKPSGDFKREAVSLSGNPDFWKTIVLVRYDLKSRTEDVRYCMKDVGDSFVILTDDITILLDPKTGTFLQHDGEKIAKQLTDQTDQHATLFELCKTCLHLPSYIEYNEETVRIERHPTRFLEDVKNGKWISKEKLLTPTERITYRNVFTIPPASTLTADTTLYQAPEFHTDTSGYWKKIPLQESGEDKHGNPIHGRTWVKKELSWVQQKEPATLRANRTKTTTSPHSKASDNNAGYIYVMHNPAHEIDLFKVGLTKRNSELRARELSKTGSPDKFLIAHEWKVTDCSKAEKAIHEALDIYRINPKREFFRLPYNDLIKIAAAIAEQFSEDS